MTSLLDEFKQFALKGNVVDLAVGVVIGGAFGKIVNSLVADIIMPPIGLLTGGMKFSHLSLNMNDALRLPVPKGVEAATLNYGQFIQTTVDFLIVAAAIFAVIKLMNQLKRNAATEALAEPAPATDLPSDEIRLLTEIRDALVANKPTNTGA
jgi:large conductance mechanosensitive channel